jgi:MFS family permease
LRSTDPGAESPSRPWALYAAGFTTAFGAHGVAASLGAASSEDAVSSLLVLGGLLALYDGAEVVLKPVFGTLADRIGARPVLLGGLLAFAAASSLYAIAGSPGWLWAARLGQGAAASAFSPAASALVARLSPPTGHGRAFGRYGFYKSLGYTLGPLLGGVLVWAGGLRLLFGVMAVLAACVAAWAAATVPSLPPLPRARQTLHPAEGRAGARRGPPHHALRRRRRARAVRGGPRLRPAAGRPRPAGRGRPDRHRNGPDHAARVRRARRFDARRAARADDGRRRARA